jgi:hypothetical protein
MEGRGVVLAEFPWVTRARFDRSQELGKTLEAGDRLRGRPQQSRSE